MTEKNNFISLVRKKKPLVFILLVVFFIVEIEILAIISSKSGTKIWLHVQNDAGDLVYSVEGRQLSDNDKKYIEKTFGPLENYQIKLNTKEIPFPFRAWFFAAVGIPIGFILMLGFIVQAYFSFFYRDEQAHPDPASADEQYDTKFEKLFGMIGRLNIFAIGFLVFLAVFLYWVIPNSIMEIGRISIDVIFKYKWFFLSAAMIFLAIFLWITYLRYLLAKKNIESRTDLDKYRLELEFKQASAVTPQLEYNEEENNRIPIEMGDIMGGSSGKGQGGHSDKE